MAHLLMYSTNYTVCRRALYAFAHALRVHLQHHVTGSWFHCLFTLPARHTPLPGAGRGTHNVEGHGGTPAFGLLGF